MELTASASRVVCTAGYTDLGNSVKLRMARRRRGWGREGGGEMQGRRGGERERERDTHTHTHTHTHTVRQTDRQRCTETERRQRAWGGLGGGDGGGHIEREKGVDRECRYQLLLLFKMASTHEVLI